MGISGEATSVSAILRDLLASKISRNPAYSLRALARDLNVSHTYLSLVLSGKRQLSPNKAVAFSQLLSLGARESELFLEAATREAKGRVLARVGVVEALPKKAKLKAEYFEMAADHFKILAEWYHLPILDLTLTRGFKSDPGWIAQRLGIAPEQAKAGIERLLRVGMLVEEEGGKLRKSMSHLLVRPKRPDGSVRAYHRKMIALALESLESGAQADFDGRDITGVLIPVDTKRLARAKAKIAKFRLAMMKYLSGGTPDELYHLNVQLFPLSRRGTAGTVLKKGVKP